MPDLRELCAAAVEAATGGEAVEAYAEESRHTEVERAPRRGRGADVRGVARRRRSVDRAAGGSATRMRPTPRRTRCATTVARARENAALAEPDEFNVLPRRGAAEPMPGPVPRGPGRHPRPIARSRWRWIWSDAAISRRPARHEGRRGADRRRGLARRDRVERRRAGRVRADRRLVRRRLARGGGRRDPDGLLVHDRPRASTSWTWEAIADEAVERAVRMLGAAKPPTAKVPIVLDQFAAIVLPRRAGRGAVRRGGAEAALAVRDDGRAAGRVRAVHAGRRRHDHDRAGARRRSTTRACRPAGPSCSPAES